MKFTQVKLLLCLLLAANPGYAAAESAVDRLTALLAEMQAFRSEFKQISSDGRGTNVQETTGVIAVKRPGLFYWKTQPPFEQQVVSDGVKLWLYDPDLEQVTVQQLDPRATQTPALLLSGEVESLQASYQISAQQVDRLWVFELTPKDPESLFEQLRLTFKDRQLVAMHLLDSLGQRSSFEFLNPQLNIELAPQLFEFTPPEGVDVIAQ